MSDPKNYFGDSGAFSMAGRNDPCPCGSGLKFKKCCMAEKNDSPDKDEISGVRAKAVKAMSDQDWDSAVDYLREILEINPNDFKALESLAASHEGREDWLLACEYYEKTLKYAPENRIYSLLFQLGVCRACAGRTDKAAAAFKESLRYTSDSGQMDMLRQMISELESSEDGTQVRDKFLVRVQLQRAFTDMDAEQYAAAAARLEKLTLTVPDNPVVFYNLGVVYIFLKADDKALEHFQRSVDLEPGYAEAYYNMGQVNLLTKKDFARALNCFSRAALIRPDYIGAHHQMGITYELLGDKIRSLESFKKALELDPENSRIKKDVARLNSDLCVQDQSDLIK
jgi:tetratricopeptide (TPR) repeat protein